MIRYLEKIAFQYERVEISIQRLLFLHSLPRIASNRLELVRRFRLALRLLVPVSVLLALSAVAFMSAKVLNLAGLLFDLAGIARVFLDEEWERILRNYEDETLYPSGPPSYVTRELFQDDNPESLGEVDENSEALPMARHFYWQRGLVLVLIGLTLQFIAAVLSD